MDKESVIKIVDKFHQALLAMGISPSKIILYGSYASGIYREGSDIDLIVISEDFIGKDYWERIDILTDVIYELFAPIEAVAMTQKEWDQGESFVVDFAQNGEVLFAA
jgi:uncharacterized protein